MSVTGKEEEQKSKEARFCNAVGSIFMQRREFDQAILLLTQSLETDPKFVPPYNNLAWLLATADDAGLRNGKEAVRLALKACELSNWKNPGYLDTLAAAYARAGDFDKAIQWQEKALEGMKSLEKGQESGLEPIKPYENDKTVELRRRLNLYRTHKPWPPN
ncbi:MAG: hypothetical protein A2170_10145 [Deltaproteobacteria bacterium RBG_13_53_10]|nr:MAG: hypothetical protein A2170_10145 [Deltaproteobacteria bacterium RBG_13_53_10]